MSDCFIKFKELNFVPTFTADSISGRNFQSKLIDLWSCFLHGCLGYKHSQCILRAGFSFCSFMVGWRAVSKEKQ